jgi:hypothetical protein
VPREDEPNRRPRQRIEQVKILLARNAEDKLDAFALQALNEQIGSLHSTLQ